MSTILITGGHRGVGLAAVQRLAADGHHVLIAGRSPAAMEHVAAELRRAHGATVEPVALDVSSLASVRAGAAAIRNRGVALDALLLNAGVQLGKERPTSADGHEMTFATNVLGPALLATLLVGAMAPAGRIVFTASGTHDPASMDSRVAGRPAAPDAAALARGEAREAGGASKPLSGARRYTTSKLCDILLAYELDRRLKAAGSRIATLAFDPGFIPETGMMNNAPAPLRALLRTAPAKALLTRLGVTEGRLPFSGECLARLATDPAFAEAGGTYWQSHAGTLAKRRSSDASYDAAAARKLWDDCAALTGVTSVERPAGLAA